MHAIEFDGQTGEIRGVDEKLVNDLAKYLAKTRFGHDRSLEHRSKKEIERMFRDAKRWLTLVVAYLPKEKRERFEKYVQRLEVSAQNIPQLGRANALFNRVAYLMKALESRELAEQEEERRKQQEQQERNRMILEVEKEWRRNTKVDKDRVRQLQKIIETADVSLLVKLHDAMAAFRRAREARRELDNLYETAEIACRRFNEKPPARPKIKSVDPRAAEMYDQLVKADRFVKPVQPNLPIRHHNAER